MKSRKIIIHSILSIVILASGSALAGRPSFFQGGQNEKQPEMTVGQQGFMQHGAAFNHARMALKLQLTETQREEVKAIFEAAREVAQPVVDQLVLNRQEIQNLIKADSYDEASVQALAEAQGELSSQLVLIRANSKAAVYVILTDEQKTILEEGVSGFFTE